MTPTPSIDELVATLSDRRTATPASAFPADRSVADHPGLYAWWADDKGLALLGYEFDVELPPLIYAGQAGATSARSRTERVATLLSRIGGNHLNGNISSSTFRRTLTAILFEPLGLRLAATGRLDAESNRNVSSWMRQHLSVTVAPFDDRGVLAVVEHAVLVRLDPPLNLQGMPPSVVRSRLRRLRSELAAVPGESPDVTSTSRPPSDRPTRDSLMLHEAMSEVLRDAGWLSFGEVAARIESRNLYRKKDGGFADPGQLRMRATLSGGRYAHLFEVDGSRVRLAVDDPPSTGS
ncbi:MAG TPA: hypothetical protein VFJ85_09210 [Acidimicrobiales bacterium]|nr:hypothetical protein [Acidimicrobiales bacterium]